MSTVKLTISIPDATKFEQALQQARRLGLQVEGAFDVLGVATGSIDDTLVAQLRNVDGVEAVEAERSYVPF